MIRGHKNRVVLDGLPDEINTYAFNYTDQEKWENPLEVIECLVTMHATFSGGITETQDVNADDGENEEIEMPTEQNFLKDLSTYANFKTEDPSQYYDITSKYKLGSGGFAKVFKVQRKSDNKEIALKFI